MIILAVATLIILHALDGRELSINPRHITSLHEALDDDASGKLIVKGARCMVNTSDGKYLSVVELCSVVRQMIEEAKQ